VYHSTLCLSDMLVPTRARCHLLRSQPIHHATGRGDTGAPRRPAPTRTGAIRATTPARWLALIESLPAHLRL
jgi:hypothetical protein